ncbi:MAG: McrC family protein, partial [Ruminococcus sp.]|nr:McrC family protein [Ruminococcus sp.]
MKIVDVKDWSGLPKDADIPWERCRKCPGNFNIHEYENRWWTGGYIGVNRLKKYDGSVLCGGDGGEVILRVTPRFGVDPWKMLDAVVADDEYPEYIKNRRDLFEIFVSEPSIRCGTDGLGGGELLLAVSFVKACEQICRRDLRSRMAFAEENLTAKVKGRILFGKHIRQNVFRGREDRMYCRYSSFSVNTPENQVIKAGLVYAEKILRRSGIQLPNVEVILRYCKTALKDVSGVPLSAGLINSARTSGVYSRYKTPVRYAAALMNRGTLSVSHDDEQVRDVVPFVINMETLFEYYVRARVKAVLASAGNTHSLEKYNKEIKLLRKRSGVSHLSDSCVPDIIITDNGRAAAVFDVKYKDRKRPNIEDSHQLMDYVLLLGAERCGFILPADAGEEGRVAEGTVNSALTADIKYEEYI